MIATKLFCPASERWRHSFGCKSGLLLHLFDFNTPSNQNLTDKALKAVAPATAFMLIILFSFVSLYFSHYKKSNKNDNSDNNDNKYKNNVCKDISATEKLYGV